MFRCEHCEQEFEEPKEYREYRGECWGFPAYEALYCCPYCNSDEIKEVQDMEITNMEHDGCCDCKYEELMEYEKPCVNCKGTVRPSSKEYEAAPDLYEPIGVEPVKDLIHHPAHYCYSEYEPKDVIRAWGLNFNLGSAVKYIARAGRKDDIVQELSKAKQFIEFEIEAIEKERAQ